MLTLGLRNIERDGFVSRKVKPTALSGVEWALTAMEQDLFAPIAALAA